MSLNYDMTSCDAANPLIMAAMKCSIPIATLLAAPFNLPWGSSIFAVVQAYNNYGDSYNSDPGNGAVIITFPGEPLNIVDN